MLIEIYLLLAGMGILFTVLSFVSSSAFKKDIHVLTFSAAPIFFVLAISSGVIETSYCDNFTAQANATVSNITTYSNSWKCTTQKYSDASLMTFWGAFGTLMILYGVLSIFVWTKESVEGYAEKLK